MVSTEVHNLSDVSESVPDDLSRNVYCVLGIPVDAIGMPEILSRIRAAASSRTRFLISTPNLNFLASSLSDSEFRESLLLSDLCPADGMSIVWVARLLGVPISDRVTGADIFDELRTDYGVPVPLSVFLFGGPEGVAAMACRALNSRAAGLRCVGSYFPGFGTVDDMGADEIIENVNASGADFLAVSLGARKGQSWLLRNHSRLRIPVRVHLGATVNFQAGTVRRAPRPLQRLGFEWLWRIKEEPHLWRRYFNDGIVLLRLLLTHVLPLHFWNLRNRQEGDRKVFSVVQTQNQHSVTLQLAGDATAPNVAKAISAFSGAVNTSKRVLIDFSGTRTIDARFLGLLLMVNKQLKVRGANPTLIGLSPQLHKLFRLHGLEFLISHENRVNPAGHIAEQRV
jgi:N-acetylglucosaminyldiphosphoundecaprenol N-acetyl-beta-D-mannosaminyltransferase